MSRMTHSLRGGGLRGFRVASSILLLVAGIAPFSGAAAQDATDDQADVWAVIEAQWDSEANNDRRWMDRLLTEDFSGWSNDTPAPRSRASIKMWDRFTDEQSQMAAHELYPYLIVVHGDTAVAHYFYSAAYEDNDGEVEISNGRYTDVLVRTEDGWRFIAWHGGDDATDD